MLNISEISNNLELKNEIWYSKNKSDVSYPVNDNDLCFQIEDNSVWFKHRNNCILEMIKNFPPESEIFDIGGGNGFVSKRLLDNGFTTIMVEPGIKGVLNAQSRNITNIICSTLEDSGFKENSIPAIGCFDVIEHINNDQEFVSKIKSLLIYGGRLYLTVPSPKLLWSNEDKKAGHFRRYSKKGIEELVEGTGLVIEYSTYIFSILFFPVLLFRTIPYWFGFGKAAITQKKIECQHTFSFAKNIFTLIWNNELKLVKNKRIIFFGSSCLLCAVKKGYNVHP